jgi:hypothetical protein
MSGYAYDIPIEYASLPEGTLIISDSQRLGELLIKKTIEENASISDIAPSEYEKVLSEIRGLTAEQLPEKVRFLAFETIRLDILDPQAVIILQKKDTDLASVKVI